MPPAYQDILVSEKAGVATVTLNRPERLNAFRGQTLLDLATTLEAASHNRRVGVIVITGAGDRAFSVGGDIEEMKGLNQKTGPLFVDLLIRVARDFLESPKPIIARVNGYCLGGGHEIHLFCDLTIASDKALFGQVGPKVGSAPLWGGTQILPLLAGPKKAKEIVFLCRQYSAREAEAMGLVNFVVPPDRLDQEVERVCRELLEKSPQSLSLARASMNAGILAKVEQDLRERLTAIYGSPELSEGMGAFLEKRPPDFARFRT